MDSGGIGLVALILSGTVAVMTAAVDNGPFAWRGKRVADDCPAAVIGGCRGPSGPVTFHPPKNR